MKVLVPMDFSDVSVNALKYALALVDENQIVIVHVTSKPDHLQNQIKESLETVESQLIKTLKSYILKRTQKESWFSNVRVVILSGEAVHEIKGFVEKNDFDYVIIGTRDNFNIIDRWVGTVALGLVKTLNVPVYLIPLRSSFQGFEKIVVASDIELVNDDLIASIRSWNEQHQAYVKFLHVQESDVDSFEEESKALIQGLFEKSDPPFGFEIVNMKSRHVKTALLASAYNFKADLLIAISKHQSFVESLLFSSLTKELIEDARIPILFFHAD